MSDFRQARTHVWDVSLRAQPCRSNVGTGDRFPRRAGRRLGCDSLFQRYVYFCFIVVVINVISTRLR